MKVGEKVLLPEYGGTKIVLDDKVQHSKAKTQHKVLINVLLFFPLINGFFLFHITRTTSCSVMEISLENTPNESSCFVLFFKEKILSP